MTTTDYDGKKFKCAPWHGKRGPAWTDVFKSDFENMLRGEKDNFSNQYQYLFGRDFGGWAPGAPPHIAGAGALAAQNALSIQSRESRGDTFIYLVKTHIVNRDITDGIDAEYAALVGRAPAAPPAGPGGPAIANTLPTDWAKQMWDWIGNTYGQARQTGLLETTQDGQWAAAKLTDVGIDRDTIRRWFSHLQRMNRSMVVPHNIQKVWSKFMSQITFPRMLYDKAQNELQNPTFLIAAGPNAGQPDLPNAVTAFEELWQSIYDKGIEIKPQAAPTPRGPPSNRVDGMMLSINDRSAEIYQMPPQDSTLATAHHVGAYNWVGLTDAEIYESYVVTAGTEAFAFLKDERNCWICRGWGHTKEKCPSSKRGRPISACIQGLQQLQEAQNARLRNMQGGRRVRRPGPSPRGAARASQQSHSAETLIEYDDGGVYTEAGVEVVAPTLAMQEPDAVTPVSHASQTVTAQQPDVAPPAMHASQAVTSEVATATTPADSLPAPAPEQMEQPAITYSNMDAEIEKQFQSSMHMASTVDSEEFVRVERSRSALLIACSLS